MSVVPTPEKWGWEDLKVLQTLEFVKGIIAAPQQGAGLCACWTMVDMPLLGVNVGMGVLTVIG